MSEKEFNIGLIYFGSDFGIELENRLNNLEPFQDKNGDTIKIHAEHVLVHEIDLDYKTKYNMIIDRGSHLIKQGVSVLMSYAFKGIYIINNPLSFHFFINNKDVGYYMANELGINIPKTFILPPHTSPYFEKDEDFKYHKHFDWDNIAKQVGFPCIIKPADGRGAMGVNKANDIDELIKFYNHSGEKIMTVQQFIDSDNEWQVRCLCIGRKIVPIKYIFRTMDMSEYIFDENFLTKEQGEHIIDSCKIINKAFGYEMNSVEFMIDNNGTPWAIDFNNPVPDGRLKALGSIFYNDYQNAFIERIKEVVINKPKYLFLPNLNQYSEIAQMNISKKEKFELAVKEANKYYLDGDIY